VELKGYVEGKVPYETQRMGLTAKLLMMKQDQNESSYISLQRQNGSCGKRLNPNIKIHTNHELGTRESLTKYYNHTTLIS
jgi:hypothetical protein